MQAYCVKCHAKKRMKNPESITMKNGRPATRGICPTCGTKMFRIGKSQKVARAAGKKMKVKAPSTLTRYKVKTSPTLTRYGENPVISPREGSWWESRQTFNPGAALLEDKVHILYRAIGDDGISRLGYAVSREGFKVEERLGYPAYQHPVTSPEFTIYSYSSGGSFGGSEDPRLVRVGNEDVLYMTYTACEGGLRVGLTSIKVKDFLDRKWAWSPPRLISPPGEVHKNWVIFPEKIKGKYAILHSLCPKISISYLDSLDFKPGSYLTSYHNGGNGIGREAFWDSIVRGAGPPPIKTELGWLIFYHAISKDEPYRYKIGATLVDLKDPKRVIRCSAAPILEPDAVYENSGFKPGVVYLSGAVVKDGELLLYYGASDSYVCVASCRLEDFLAALMDGGRDVFMETKALPSPRQKKQRVSRPRHSTPSSRKTKGRKRG
jgi:predicted GH43/DUF377 family glycosyl hydrolase